MKRLSTILVSAGTFLYLFVALPSEAEAGVYRCNGMVQSRPCDQPFSYRDARNQRAARPAASVARAQLRPTAGLRATGTGGEHVVSQHFKRLANGLGLWHGRVAGNGRVHLYLQIFRNGELESTRYMGNVELTPQDRSISFHFQSPQPEGTNWSWKILTALG